MEDYKFKGIGIVALGGVVLIFLVWLFFFSPASIFSSSEASVEPTPTTNTNTSLVNESAEE